ncbi:Outer membrane protein beta-barrel domain-containing protein [Mesonia phycicola]|uniref:Outer membrane protein beta-barrel domain-containing protein n=1 Tax=Mesonia phycicola TaxID=579105 RepID=A0A1M6HDJ6_9FLAO|nr:outer membrane beta-barrel protein [Mesonia phycicola]SHJ20224.1 Outer membrane protein beta-barrel domain-containing protein [Mesonia phycicola]
MKSLYINNSNFINFVIIVLFFVTTLEGWSQNIKSEFSINASGIFSQLDYDLPQGYLDKDRGWSAGVGYAYYLTPQWSINLEGNYQKYSSTALINTTSGSYQTTDFENEDFEFRYVANNYQEQQELDVIHIPLTLQFQTDGDTKFYIRGGVQIGILFNSTYTSSVEKLSTSGYYEQYNVELFDPIFMGFGEFSDVFQKNVELDWDMSYSTVLETGVKAEVGDARHLYIGFFVNYGIASISSDSTQKQLIEYEQNTPSDYTLGGIFKSGLAQNARLQSFGIKLRYALGGY